MKRDPRLSELCRPAYAATLVDVPRTTLLTAIKRGEIPTYTTVCGLVMVKPSEVKKWAPQKRSRGPKPKGQG